MAIRKLFLRNFLSFGPEGQEIELRNLNVLIGPNGSGKSNLIDALAMLRSAPTDIAIPIRNGGGISEWIWRERREPDRLSKAELTAFVDRDCGGTLRHEIVFGLDEDAFFIFGEDIEVLPDSAAERELSDPVYRFEGGVSILWDGDTGKRELPRLSGLSRLSILSQLRDAGKYSELAALEEAYSAIRLFRNWTLGPTNPMRVPSKADDRTDFLVDAAHNLPLVLQDIKRRIKPDLSEALKEVYHGAVGLDVEIFHGQIRLLLLEESGLETPTSRLSDGTLRYLALLAILLHPSPPGLVVIEEPELGLHPDLLVVIARLLKDASQRCQLVVTTHSRVLVDALTDDPESVIVCERHEGRSRLERLDKEALKGWLDKYSLGQLWDMGHLGGNRW